MGKAKEKDLRLFYGILSLEIAEKVRSFSQP